MKSRKTSQKSRSKRGFGSKSCFNISFTPNYREVRLGGGSRKGYETMMNTSTNESSAQFYVGMVHNDNEHRRFRHRAGRNTT